MADAPLVITLDTDKVTAEVRAYIDSKLAALEAEGRLLPAPTEVRTEYAAWCHGEDRDGIRLPGEGFTSPQRASEWAEQQFGRYGITGYRVMRREHHIFAEGEAFASASTDWVEDTEGQR